MIQAQARICPICYDDHSEGRNCATLDLIEATALRDVKIAADQSRIEKLERMVVWCVENYVALHGKGRMVWSIDGKRFEDCGHDGTAPSILAAVEKAMGEAKP